MEHSLALNKRTNLSLTGIKKVKSAEPTTVVAEIENGAIVVSGNGLAVETLDVKGGTMTLVGMVNAIKYTNKSAKSFSLKNMFK